MDVYIFLCYLFGISAVIERILPINIRKILFFINGLILLIIVGGRSCGTDYWLYKSVIEKGLEEEVLWPPLFVCFTKLVPFQVLIYIIAASTIIPFYYIMYKIANGLYNLAAAFFFTEYFFMTLMQQSRQGVALASIAVCVVFFNRKKIKIAVMSIFSGLIHITGYFGFLLLCAKNKFYDLKTYIWVYGLSLILGSFVFNYMLSNISSLGIALITSKMVGYTERTEMHDAVIPIFSFRFFLFFSMLYYCYYNRHKLLNKSIPYMCNVLFGGICFYTLFNPIVDLAVRGSNCFILLYFFIVLMVMGEQNINNAQKNIIYGISMCYCFYLMNRYLDMIIKQNSDLNLIPYSFFI